MSAKAEIQIETKEATSKLVSKVKRIAKAWKEVTALNYQLNKEVNEHKATIKDLRALLIKHEETRKTVKKRLVKLANQLPSK